MLLKNEVLHSFENVPQIISDNVQSQKWWWSGPSLLAVSEIAGRTLRECDYWTDEAKAWCDQESSNKFVVLLDGSKIEWALFELDMSSDLNQIIHSMVEISNEIDGLLYIDEKYLAQFKTVFELADSLKNSSGGRFLSDPVNFFNSITPAQEQIENMDEK